MVLRFLHGYVRENHIIINCPINNIT